MNFFERRRWRKIVKQALHDARHARHMREDIAPPPDIEALVVSEVALQEAWKRRDAAGLESALDALGDRIHVVSPPRPQPKIRENVEIIAVAVAVAMGFRTYFIQPFKIPTGSMQPTLYGINIDGNARKEFFDYFPLNVARLCVFGERYVEVRAKSSGAISLAGRTEKGNVYMIGGIQHAIGHDLTMHRLTSPYAQKGQVLASGRRRQGDHIFVNKVIYNFRKPARGNIFVFSTDGIKDARIRPNTFYIKRLAGLPGERISLDPPHLVANGERITSPYPFQRLVNDVEAGYVGYQLPESDGGGAVLANRQSVLSLGPGRYLPLGDNTRSSLDGRYFGAVPEQSIVGPAFMVYWPFGKRWGWVR